MTQRLAKSLRETLAVQALEDSHFMVFWVMDTGYFIYTNPAAQQALGYTAEELAHMRAADVLLDYDPEARKKLREEIRTEKDGFVRAVLVRKDGSTFAVEASNNLLEIEGHTINCAISRALPLTTQSQKGQHKKVSNLNSAKDMRRAYAMADELNIIGSSKQLREVLKTAQLFARQDWTPVLILGETGVGKESLARFVHDNSPRSKAPFIPVNCANFSENDLESKLFGHAKGAYTGAIKDRKGTFATATGGTLFLDELGELSEKAQQKLLRVLEDGMYYRMGEDKLRKCDVRVVAATNSNLPKMIKQGKFRQDLYYRLEALHINIPPLRRRKSDIPELVDYKLAQLIAKSGTPITRPNKEGMKLLKQHSYPGNIRELFNLLERAFSLSRGPALQITPELFNVMGREGYEMVDNGNAFLSWEEMQIAHITRALNRCYWKISGEDSASELLGLNANTLRGKMRKLAITKAP